MTVKPFQQANQLLREGKLEDAVVAYRRAIEQNPQFYGAYQNLGETLGKLGRLDKAVEMYGKAIELKPSSGWLHQELGLLLEKFGEEEEAATYYKKATKLEPKILEIEQNWSNSLFTPNTKIEDGDSYDSILNRVEQAIEFLKSKPDPVLGVVTHQFFLNAFIIKAILGNSVTPEIYKRLQEQYWLENTGIVVLYYHLEYPYTGWKLITYNDTAHLDYLKG